MVGGSMPAFMASMQMAVSRLAVPPMRCPVMDLVELIGIL